MAIMYSFVKHANADAHLSFTLVLDGTHYLSSSPNLSLTRTCNYTFIHTNTIPEKADHLSLSLASFDYLSQKSGWARGLTKP